MIWRSVAFAQDGCLSDGDIFIIFPAKLLALTYFVARPAYFIVFKIFSASAKDMVVMEDHN